MGGLYQQLLQGLAAHLSATNARVVLDRSLQKQGISAGGLNDGNLSQVIAEVERRARLFVDTRDLEQLHRALRNGGSSADPVPITISIGEEGDISRARVQTKLSCEQLGASSLVVHKVATVVSELTRNIIEYTPGGYIEIVPHLRPRPHIIIRAVDKGTGIPNLEQILAGQYKSRTGLGVGLRGSKQLMDRFVIETGAQGTRIEAEAAW